MNPRVLRRFIILMAALTVGMFLFWDLLKSYVTQPAGDFDTKMGDQRLTEGNLEQALEHFNLALESPDHRGALMGRALVFIQQDDYDSAIAELDYLIDYLHDTLEDGDGTGRALEDYIASLNVDRETVEGPGVIHKILYGSEDVSTVRDRARYIYEQLQLPEDQRLMRVPELDEKQRMYKP
jgi:tetratricopeptide (TPR) repeat protein